MNWDEVIDFHEIQKNDSIIREKVVGMSFLPGYPSNLYLLFDGSPLGRSKTATLKRNPENKYDENACEVFIGAFMVGHLPRNLAAEVAPKLDAGENYTMTVSLLVTPGKEGNPGLAFQLLFEEGDLN